MFGNLFSFFAKANPILALVSTLLPILAAMRSINNPAVTNAGITNMMAAIQFVQPIVAQVEAVSNAGATKMTGPEKLQLFQLTVQQAEAALIAKGGSSELAQMMPLLDAAVAAVCATMKIPAMPVPTVALVQPEAPLANNA
jgi:hypothetical protein